MIDRAAVVAECVTPYGGDAERALEALEADERDIFERARKEAAAASVRCSTVALTGVPASRICSIAVERKVDAIAMGTHGRRGLPRIVLGSTAAAVLKKAQVPTLVLHEERACSTPFGPFRQIVVGFDGSAAAHDAVRLAVDLAAQDDGRVLLVHVAATWDGPLTEAVLAQARSYALTSGVRSDAAIVHGDTAKAIFMSAQTCHADLIALGAHAGAAGLFGMGNVTEAVVRTSTVPVLVVPLSTANLGQAMQAAR